MQITSPDTNPEASLDTAHPLDRQRTRSLTIARLLSILASAAAASGTVALAQSTPPDLLNIPAGTPIEAKLTQHIRMKAGEPVRALLAHPVYADNQLALPAGAVLQGSVIRLAPDRDLRNDARLNIDFTPYHKPVVTFTSIALPNGVIVPISTTPSSDGAPAIHLAPAAPGKRRTLVGIGVETAKGWISSTKEAIFAPGLGDRLLQLFYRQLPYHPERIPQGTTWSFELSEPSSVPAAPAPEKGEASAAANEKASGGSKNIEVHAHLDEELNSSKSKVGQQFKATVLEPVRGADNSLIVPQGAVLIGRITRAKAARSFHRDGSLRFDFREIQVPGGSRQQIIGSVAGLEARSGTAWKMDSEGGVQSQPQGRLIVPLVLGVLADRTLDSDSNLAASAAVGSNGMGLIGRIVGITAASRQLAAGIGFYGTAVSIYRRGLRHGRDITFPKDTRIEIQLSERLGQQISQH